MNSVKKLPFNYLPDGAIDLKNRKLVLLLNVVALVPLALFGWLFLQIAAAWRPEYTRADTPLVRVIDQTDLLPILFGLLAMLLLHELIHGIFFWLFTGDRPVFGFHILYAYAAAPGWFLTRNRFLITGMAPFVIITLGGLLMLPSIPFRWVPLLLIILAVNGAGSVGDFIVAGWLLTKPASLLINDNGPRIAAFRPMAASVEKLGERWFELATDLGVQPDDAHYAYQTIATQYTEKGRHYHTLDHIERVLDMAEGLRSLAADFNAVQLALWFHDIVYDPRADDNEARSAEMAGEILESLGLPPVTVLKVTRLILCTTSHRVPDGDIDAQIVTDADLSSLAADEKTFRRDSDNVRLEFSWVPEKNYRAARVKALSNFMKREYIYQTDHFRATMEPLARANLTREIALHS